MKIIGVDNFNRETRSDSLIAENVDSYYGKLITDHLNERLCGEGGATFYELVPDDHKLFVFEP